MGREGGASRDGTDIFVEELRGNDVVAELFEEAVIVGTA